MRQNTRQYIIGLDIESRELKSYKFVEEAERWSSHYQLIEASTVSEAKRIYEEVMREGQYEEL